MITIGLAIVVIIVAMMIGVLLSRAVFPFIQKMLHHTHGQYPVKKPPKPPRKPARYGPGALLEKAGVFASAKD